MSYTNVVICVYGIYVFDNAAPPDLAVKYSDSACYYKLNACAFALAGVVRGLALCVFNTALLSGFSEPANDVKEGLTLVYDVYHQ